MKKTLILLALADLISGCATRQPSPIALPQRTVITVRQQTGAVTVGPVIIKTNDIWLKAMSRTNFNVKVFASTSLNGPWQSITNFPPHSTNTFHYYTTNSCTFFRAGH